MAQGGAHGRMEIQDQRETYHGFLQASLWVGGLIAQSVMLFTLAFAIGFGWWPGLFAFIAIGVVIGLLFRMSGAYWAVQIALWLMLGLGGMVVPALSSLMS
jgi:type IV secretory pathway VirB6-like protein